ncbi:hypothetical protein SESBI_43723 [Sesbania bispinosa]|nr:hypothetical protein SESBI_43723 [Sesbania bispinosa]
MATARFPLFALPYSLRPLLLSNHRLLPLCPPEFFQVATLHQSQAPNCRCYSPSAPRVTVPAASPSRLLPL